MDKFVVAVKKKTDARRRDSRPYAVNFLPLPRLYSHFPRILIPFHPMADRIPIPMGIPLDPWDPSFSHSHTHLYSEYLCLSAVPVGDKITLVKLLGKIPSLVCPLFCCSQHPTVG